MTDAGRNITLSFAEAVKKDNDGADFADGDLSSILTLRQTNSSGTAIGYAATIDAAKQVITINPTSNLPEGAIYVAVTNGYYDAAGNQGTAANATFTVDATGPGAPTFSPLDSATVTNAGTNITLTFAEAVKKDNDGADFSGQADLAAVLTLRQTNSSGTVIPYAASIDSANRVVTLNPASDLAEGAIYVAVTNGYYDAAGNQGTAASATFTVDSTGVAAPTFNPANNATVTNAGTNITLTFAEAVKTDNSGADFSGQADLAAVLTLRQTNSSGTVIPYVASIDSANRVITLNPASNLAEGAIYVAVTSGYYDAVGQPGDGGERDLHGGLDRGGRADLHPANNATVTNAGTNITLTFAEAVKKDNSGADFSGQADLAAVLTLRQTNSSGTVIPYAASIDSANRVITLNPASNLPEGAIYVAVTSGYYDAAGNQGTAASATFTVDSTGVAAPTFNPANNATVTNAGTNITLTFAEAVKKDGDGADFSGQADLAAVLTLRQTNSSGTVIPYAASIDSANRVVTLNPASDLPEGAIYVAVTNGYYDAAGNQGAAANATFTVDATGPAAPTFSPARRGDGDGRGDEHHADLRRGGEEGRLGRGLRGAGRPGSRHRDASSSTNASGDGHPLRGEHRRRRRG